MNRKKVILLLSVCVLSILGIIMLFIYTEDKNKVIMVDGFEIEFNVSDARLKIEDFDEIELGMSYDEIKKIIGEPDYWIGSGVLRPLYFLKDGKVLVCQFEYPFAYKNLEIIEIYEGEKYYIFKK